jgi:predicted DNA binding protein
MRPLNSTSSVRRLLLVNLIFAIAMTAAMRAYEQMRIHQLLNSFPKANRFATTKQERAKKKDDYRLSLAEHKKWCIRSRAEIAERLKHVAKVPETSEGSTLAWLIADLDRDIQRTTELEVLMTEKQDRQPNISLSLPSKLPPAGRKPGRD